MTNTSVQPSSLDGQQPASSPSSSAVVVTETSTSPTVNSSDSASSPVKKRKFNPQILLGLLAVLVLLIGGGVGFFLMSSNTELRQQAATYADCGNMVHGEKACSGFREVMTCNNGVKTTQSCGTQVCQGGSCVAQAAQNCAGNVAPGNTACLSSTQQITCGSNGQFDQNSIVTCPAGQTCSGGKCGGTGGQTTCSGDSGDTTCRGRLPGAACQLPGGGNGTCNGAAGQSCSCSSGGTGGTTPTPSAGVCSGAGGSCSINPNGTSTCCGGLVCQNGVSGQLRCEDPGTGGQCPGGGVCGGNQGWIGFRCSQLTNGQCNENPQTFNDYGSAAAHAGGCGQVDEVCVGGSNNRNLCGDFQIFSSSCGGPTQPPTTPPTTPPSPVPTPTPGTSPSPSPVVSPSPSPSVTPTPGTSPSPTPGPVCLDITASSTNVRVGDEISFTCGQVAGITRYEFRVRLPDGTMTTLNAASAGSNSSEEFRITQTGNHTAQCRICLGTDGRCQEWEPLLSTQP